MQDTLCPIGNHADMVVDFYQFINIPRLFFDHLGTILLMAVVGTVLNVLTIGRLVQ